MRSRLTGRLSLLILSFAVAMIVFPAVAFAETVAPDGTTAASLPPTIQSDQSDYAPGDTVNLTGSNWQPGESVHINVNDDQTQTWSRDVDVTADASGNVTDQFQLPNTFVAVYKVTATGAQSGVATTTFTDGNVIFRQGSNYTQDYKLSYTIHSGTVCNGGGTAGSLEVNNNSVNNAVAVNTNQSLKITGVAQSPGGTAWPAGIAFDGWSSDQAGDTPETNLCIPCPGNSTTRFAQFKDTTPISTTITSKPSDPSNDNTPSFSYSSNHTGSSVTFECSLDGAAFSTCNTNNPGSTTKTYGTTADGSHTFQVRAVDKTLSGNVVSSSASYTWTVDTVPPTVSSVSPQNLATNVAVGTNVTATFSDVNSMDDSTISSSTFTLRQGGTNGALVTPVTVTYDAQSKTATLDPNPSTNGGSLAPNQQYTASLSNAIRDTAGNQITARTWSFTTGAACTNPANPTFNYNPDGSNGWYKTVPTVSATSAGATVQYSLNSGGPFSTTAPTLGQGTSTVYAKAVNGTCSSGVVSQTYNVDTVAPTINDGGAWTQALPGQATTPDGTNSWYVSEVFNKFTASDTTSGLANTAQATFTKGSGTAEGSAVKINSGSVSDKAGNTNSGLDSAAYKIDLTNPTITGSLSPQNPASSGWYNAATGAPTASFTCSDKTPGSGLATGACPANYTFGNGANQSHEGTVTDQAGRSASTNNVNGINVDLIAPSKPNASFGRAPEDPVGGYFKDQVTVTYGDSTDSGGSGLATPAYDPASQTFNTTGSHDYSGVAKDVAGNVSDAASGTVKVDASLPDVQPGDVNDTTWRNQPLSQAFTASDTGSGLANSADASFTLTASAESASDTTPTVVSKEIKDAVGNTTTRKVSALIDLHNPNIDATVLNQPASSGWYNISTGGPQVHFTCSDALSGIETGACPADHTVTTEGPSVNYSGSVSDRATNSASANAGPFKIDLTAPNVAGAPDLTTDSGDPNDNLTNVKAPTFDITAEAGSSVKLYAKKDNVETLIGQGTATNGTVTITANQNLADGEYQVYAHVTDQAGNVSNTTAVNITIVTIDATPPNAPGLDMDAASDTGTSSSDDKTNNDKPKFDGTAEAGSTLKLYDGANLLTTIQVGSGGTWSFTLTSALSEGTHTIKATATDAANNTSNVASLSVVIDKTAPAIQAGLVSGTTGSNSWYTSVVTQTFNASDTGGTGVVGPASFTKPSGTNEEGSNVTITSGSVSDVAGNTNSGVSAGPFKIDLYKPTVNITNAPAEGAKVDLCSGALPSPSFTALDTALGSQVDTKSGGFTTQPPSGTSVGAYTYTAQATDFAGLTGSATRNYSVVYDTNYSDTLGAYSGVQQPINNTSNGTTRSAFKLGSTVPVKFQLRCGTTPINNAVAKLWVSKIDNKPDEAVNETISTNSPDIGNQFRVTDTTTGQYMFNLSTKSGYVNPDQSTTSFSLGTYYLYIQLNDGTKFQAAQIDFNK
jgi:large repetitive protein